MQGFVKIGFLFLLVLTGIALFFAFQYHFILLDDGVSILKKDEAGLEYTLVDGRGAANKARLLANPALLKAGITNIFSGEGVTIRPKKELEKGMKRIESGMENIKDSVSEKFE